MFNRMQSAMSSLKWEIKSQTYAECFFHGTMKQSKLEKVEANISGVKILNLLGFLTGPTKSVKVSGSKSYPG